MIRRKIMRSKKGSGWHKSREERPLRPSKEERPLRSFNSQAERERFTDVWNTDTDSDDELSWDEDIEYRSCEYTKMFSNVIKYCLIRFDDAIPRFDDAVHMCFMMQYTFYDTVFEGVF